MVANWCGRLKPDNRRNFTENIAYFPSSYCHSSLWQMETWENSWCAVWDPLLKGFIDFGCFFAQQHHKQSSSRGCSTHHLLVIDTSRWLLSFYWHLSPGVKRPALTYAHCWLDTTGRSGQAIKTFGLLLYPWLTTWACLVTISTSLISKLVMRWLTLIECMFNFIR